MKARMATACTVGLAVVLAGGPSQAAEDCAGSAGPGAVRLTVRAHGLQSSSGEVAFTLYPNVRERFLAPGGKHLRVRVKAVAPVTSACFWAPPGAYALAVYHDANGDRDFNRDLTGAPAEGFAFSNDPPARFGLPTFEETRFSVGAAGRQIEVRMRYLGAGEASR